MTPVQRLAKGGALLTVLAGLLTTALLEVSPWIGVTATILVAAPLVLVFVREDETPAPLGPGLGKWLAWTTTLTLASLLAFLGIWTLATRHALMISRRWSGIHEVPLEDSQAWIAGGSLIVAAVILPLLLFLHTRRK